MARTQHHNESGWLAERANPHCPGTVTAYNAKEQGIDAYGNPIAVVCDAHGQIGGVQSVQAAIALLRTPDDFCTACRSIDAERPQPMDLEFRHTPGDWEVQRHDDGAIKIWEHGVLLFTVEPRPRAKAYEQLANARLAGASRRMLLALVDMVKLIEQWEISGTQPFEGPLRRGEARQAIAAALGTGDPCPKCDGHHALCMRCDKSCQCPGDGDAYVLCEACNAMDVTAAVKRGEPV